MGGLIVSALGLGAGYTLFDLQSRRVGDRESIGRARNAGATDERRARRRGQSRERGRRCAREADQRARVQRRSVKHGGPRQEGGGVGGGQRRELAPQAKRPNVWRLRPRTCAPTSTPRRASFRNCRRASRSSNPTRQRRTPPAPISPPSPLASTRSRPPSPRPRMKRAPPRRSSWPLITPRRSPLSPRLRKKDCARARRFGPELAALQRLGVDAAALAPLEAVVNGAPDQQRAGRLVQRGCAARPGRHGSSRTRAA